MRKKVKIESEGIITEETPSICSSASSMTHTTTDPMTPLRKNSSEKYRAAS
jgi:hypothetical protein